MGRPDSPSRFPRPCRSSLPLRLPRRRLHRQSGGASDVSDGLPPRWLRRGAALQVVAEAETEKAKAHVEETVQVAAPSYLAHLATNKEAYRPGELLFARALVLDRASLSLPDQAIPLRFTLTDAAG